MVPLSQSRASGNSEPTGRAFDAGGETRYPDLREGRIDPAPTFRRLECGCLNVELTVAAQLDQRVRWLTAHLWPVSHSG